MEKPVHGQFCTFRVFPSSDNFQQPSSFVRWFWFLVLLKLLTYLKISPDKGAAKLSSTPWSSFQEQGRKRSAGLAELPCSFLSLILGRFDVSTVFSSFFFFFKTHCLDYLFSKDHLLFWGAGPSFFCAVLQRFRRLNRVFNWVQNRHFLEETSVFVGMVREAAFPLLHLVSVCVGLGDWFELADESFCVLFLQREQMLVCKVIEGAPGSKSCGTRCFIP